MDNSEQRPNAALINREWFAAASDVLSRTDLAEVILRSVEYVFGLEMPSKPSAQVGLVFAMVRPSLDSDIIKYRERCERNQRNARSQSQRVAASGTQSQRVDANTTTTSTTTPTTTTTTTPSLSPAELEEKERWLIFGYFWSTGSKAVREELSAFWSYYESLGWKNNKGAAIVSKLAAARMWRRQFETGVAPDGSEAWFKVAQTCDVHDYGVWKCYAGAERLEDRVIVRLRCSQKFCADLHEHIQHLDGSLQAIWRTPAIEFQLLT